MDKGKQIYGIDISKDVYDVCTPEGGLLQFENSEGGFRAFAKAIPKNAHCVMESTGYYHLQLAYFLSDRDFAVSIVNPLKIKRFIQMNLSRIKTDKSDAVWIMKYGASQDLELWEGDSELMQENLQLTRLLSVYIKQSTQLKNKIHGEHTLGNPSKVVVSSLKRQLRSLSKEIKKLEERLGENVRSEHQKSLTLLKGIPGIGEKTAISLIVLTDNFTRFDSYKGLCSYAGITPVIRESGSSVKGRPRISKMGNAKLRNLLFMCSFNACRFNTACRALYERLVAKGKSKKLALIAVCNKLLKQAFSIVRSGLPYDPNHCSVIK
ncbi:IS110 family transposase [Nonlabens spongiae]|uniref:IS110 family transposase n=1 Tax=Nonlabens spongiae TaxID=331648 RepID=A0A1W6MGM2_9FLAO|nr:IS110 family transposase [Nonlabens spongiae]ARN76753.1 IS110 family transposase [Nonlabens spongiae]